MKKLYIIVIVFLIWSPTEILSGNKSKKKSTRVTTEATQTTTSQPAIIAIEIVDPNENSTSKNGKNSKRTIEGSLGYGYNNLGAPKARYEVYKYSQHDIPPYKGDPSNLLVASNHQVNVQKAVQYTLPTVTQHVADTSKIFQPGTTLYSSLNEKGKVGILSSSFPQTTNYENSGAPVPVVVLRLYPHQLRDSTIQAKLPKSHPYAKSINSLNIQTLLLNYIKTLKNPGNLSQYSISQNSLGQNHRYNNQYNSNQAGGGYHNQYTGNPGSIKYNSHASSHYSAPYSGNYVSPTQKNYQNYNYYDNQVNQQASRYQSPNMGNQNYQQYEQGYPQYDYSKHQYQQPQTTNYDSSVTVQEAPVKYEIRDYSGSQLGYQAPVSQQPLPTKSAGVEPQPQYYYVSQNAYPTESSQVYQPAQQEYSKETTAPPEQQYYRENVGSEYQEYYQNAGAGQQYDDMTDNQKLLTHENYPTAKHTRIVFRTKSGNVREPEEEQEVSQIKTIKIHVPENIANVEVQETEKPYYASEQASAYSEDNQNTKEQPAVETYQQNEAYNNENYYLPLDSVQQKYYNNDGSASESIYSYKNINYDDMAKYFEKRGAMPKYFFQQNLEDAKEESDETIAKPAEDIISAYEETTFPTTTSSSVIRKRGKSKKRTQV